jgi:hypothetical protein
MKRARGIEPPTPAWEAGGVPFYDARVIEQADCSSVKWQRYYWPLLEAEKVIPQINAESAGDEIVACWTHAGLLGSGGRYLELNASQRGALEALLW